MKRLRPNPISSPANPFLVLADFAIMLVLIMVLAIVHQSISSSNLINRVATEALQKRLVSELAGADPQGRHTVRSTSLLLAASQDKEIRCTITDGDLQRFWFDGRVFFEFGSSKIEPRGEAILSSFGKLLSRNQGDRHRRGNGLFKYILVEGHADSTEGNSEMLKQLSFQRASNAVSILEARGSVGGIAPVLIKSCGRGDLDQGNFYFNTDEMKRMVPSQIRAYNKRVEIVVVYSGRRALEYYERNLAN